MCTTACTPYAFPGDRERVESFRSLASVRVAGESLDMYLRRRTAVLIGEGAGGEIHISEAVSIDPRGYFLTAAHSLEATELHLFYFDGTRARVASPRVVAARRDKTRDDFAVLHVDGTSPCVFEWADDDALSGAEVATAVGGGPDKASSQGLVVSKPQCLAGRIISTAPSGALATRIFHDLPLRPGDSGGPLATVKGKLIGINTGVSVTWLGEAVSLAIRPDRHWVWYQIDRDARMRGQTLKATPALLRSPPRAEREEAIARD
jgi:S1-C subfamily serine protease